MACGFCKKVHFFHLSRFSYVLYKVKYIPFKCVYVLKPESSSDRLTVVTKRTIHRITKRVYQFGLNIKKKKLKFKTRPQFDIWQKETKNSEIRHTYCLSFLVNICITKYIQVQNCVVLLFPSQFCPCFGCCRCILRHELCYFTNEVRLFRTAFAGFSPFF